MKRILIGGSPCTHWSIAQKNNRETEPQGEGWELFKNYLITKFSDGEKKIDGCVQAFGRNWSKPFGTCLFLTREEAEQALKGGASE